MSEYERLKTLALVGEKTDLAQDVYECADDMISACLDYTQIVVRSEVLRCKRDVMDAAEYRESVQRAEQERRTCHDSLIVRVDLVNRLCEKVGVETVYQGTEARAEYGDFAMRLVEQIFGSRVR